jgi:hypothetical protein
VRPGDTELSIEAVPVVGMLDPAHPARARGATIDARSSGDKRAVWRTSLLAAAAFALVLVSNLLSLGLDNLRTNLINANWEFSWSHIADTILLGVGVCVSLVGARATRADRRLWIATGAILAVFFLDEASALHGQIGNLEKLLYAPILAALVVCVYRLTARTRESALVVSALTTLLVAFVMHVAGLHLLRPIGYTTYVYQAGVGFKEGTELAGLMLLVTALWRRARQATWRL